MKVSRSRLFTLALEEFIRRRENHQLLEKINHAYEAAPDAADRFIFAICGDSIARLWRVSRDRCGRCFLD